MLPSKTPHGCSRKNGIRSNPTSSLIPGKFNADEVWLDKQELLELVHISERTLQRWRSSGLLPFAKINGKLYYHKTALQTLMHSMELLTMKERVNPFR